MLYSISQPKEHLMDLTTATPVQIDTELAKALDKIADVLAKQNRAQEKIARIDEIEPGSYNSLLKDYSPEARAKLVALVEKYDAEIFKIQRDEVDPLDGEFSRRGGWTRYYLVDNPSGHVHKDQYCSSCFLTTTYAWLIEQSGMTAEDLVERAGEQACTVCFPWAPVDTLKRKSLLESPQRKASRLEREKAKAEREAKKAAKAISNPDGTPLQVFRSRMPERIVRGVLQPAYDAYTTLETLYAARGWLTDAYEHRQVLVRPQDIQRVAEAIGLKEGKTAEQAIEEAKIRAKKRRS